MKIIKLKESQIKEIVSKIINENSNENYMFFSNLEQIKRQCDLLLKLDHNMINDLLTNGHDWADDHISSAKENVDQVFDFFMNESKKNDLNESSSPSQQAAIATNMKKEGKKPKDESVDMEIDESKNTPTNPKLWASSLAWARSKYDVCPSAYCNGAAAKHYKAKGGGWKKSK